jgi:hypothetical protein
MATCLSDCFEDHRRVHIARSPNLIRLKHLDEKLQVGPNEGLFEFDFPPAQGIKTGTAPTSDDELLKQKEAKYLWVVAKEGVPAALEYPTNGRPLNGGRLTHTNLTGAASAHTGGELWFYDTNRIVVNGGSSRYAPRSPQELESVALSFKQAGYKVASMGWDEESNSPLRILQEKPQWL